MRTRLVIAAVATLAVAAGVVTAVALTRPAGDRHAAPAPVVAALPAPSSTPPTPTTPPSPTPTVKAAPVRELVTASVPTRFEIKGPAFDVKASVCQMAYVRPLDPPGDQRHTVCWVKSQFGVAPGSNSAGTSYILGHSWAEAPLVLNPLSIFAMKQVDKSRPVRQTGIPTYPIAGLKGYVITLTTGTGVLRYTVRDAYAVSKEQAGDVGPLMATTTPDRVVLITCGVLDGVDVDDNIIVDAYLTSSQAAHRT